MTHKSRDKKPHKTSPPEQGPPLLPSRYERVIDKRIAEAIAEGAFDNLPGAGKPLALDDDGLVPEEDRVAYRILKNAGYAPPWIELQKHITEEQDKLAEWLERANRRWAKGSAAQQEQLRAEYRQKCNELNKLITHYNLSAPTVVGQLPLLQWWREARKLGKDES